MISTWNYLSQKRYLKNHNKFFVLNLDKLLEEVPEGDRSGRETIMKKKIIIVGAGVSGLSAGIHALLKGFEVEIYESHNLVGGLCTAWNRKGYEIDGCIHWLSGSKRGTPLYSAWEICGALSEETEVVNHEHISSYMNPNGDIYYLYSDIRKMEDELLRISPEDEKEIKHFIRTVKAFQGMCPPCEKPEEMMSFFDKIKFVLPYISKGKEMQFGMNISIADYVQRFKSPIIRNLLLSTTPDIIMANALFFMLGLRSDGDGGWVQGGSLRFTQRMQQRFEKLGGKLFLKNEVSKIVIENGQSVGIQLKGKNITVEADYIVPAIDIHTLLGKLLENKYHIPYFEERFAQPQKYPLVSATLVAIAVEANLNHRPHSITFEAKDEIRVGETNYKFLAFNHYAYDPDFSPNGNTLVEFIFPDYDYDYWKKLREKSEEEYSVEKKRIGELLLTELQRVYPETVGKVKLLDVATPLTFKRYCHAYKGAYMSFLTTAGTKQTNYKGTIDGIDKLYLAGQWVVPDGGLPGAVINGKFAIQRICKREKMDIKF